MKPMLKFDFIALKHTVKLSQMKTELFQPFDFFFSNENAPGFIYDQGCHLLAVGTKLVALCFI